MLEKFVVSVPVDQPIMDLGGHLTEWQGLGWDVSLARCDLTQERCQPRRAREETWEGELQGADIVKEHTLLEFRGQKDEG